MTRPTNIGRSRPSIASLGVNKTELGDLFDVDLTGIADGDIIVWDDATDTWVVGSGSAIDVTDGTTTVSPASSIEFDPTYFDVTAPGAGVAEVTFVGSAGGLTIEEVDASPTVSATKLVLPNGTLGVVGTVATYTPAAAGGGDLTRLAETVLGADAAAITITGISNAYRSLYIVISARSAQGAEFGTLNMRMGDGSIDTGSNYSSSRDITGSGAASIGGRIASLLNLATIAANSATSGAFGYVTATILNYKNTSMMKGVVALSYMDGASDHYQGEFGGQYRSTSAEVDQVSIFADGGNNLKAGSYMTIYGIA